MQTFKIFTTRPFTVVYIPNNIFYEPATLKQSILCLLKRNQRYKFKKF